MTTVKENYLTLFTGLTDSDDIDVFFIDFNA